MIGNTVNQPFQCTNENRPIATRGGHFEVNEEKWRPSRWSWTGLFTQL